MGLKDDILALLGKDQNAPTSEPQPDQDPAPSDQDTPKEDPTPTEPAPTGFTVEEVNQMIDERIKEERSTIAKEMAETLKAFKGNDVPAVGTPSEPVGTADFSQWNKAIKEIEENNK